jgi:Centrosome localisation domain of PPC89
MSDLIIAVLIGWAFGYIMKPAKRAPINETLQNQVEQLEEKIAYYKKLTKELANENNQFRRQLPHDGCEWKANKDII